MFSPRFFPAVERYPRTLLRLPIGGLHDLGHSRALGPADQFQNLGALVVGARCLGDLRSLFRRLLSTTES
jgi:hypothetical protein